MSPIKENIIKQRKLRGFSQEFVAEQLEVSRQAVSKWETGQSEPSMDNLIKLSSLFGVDIKELIDLETHEAGKLRHDEEIKKNGHNTRMRLAAFFGHIFVMVGYSGFAGLCTRQGDAMPLPHWYWLFWFALGLALTAISSRDYYREQKYSPLMYLGYLLFIFAVFALPSLLPFSRSWTALISNITAGATVVFLNLKFWRHRWSR